MEHIESGKMILHPVPYSGKEFSRYIEAVIRPLCTEKNICFSRSCDGPDDFVVLQDKLRINQVYFNLLSNAVKFTPEGGQIRFHTHIEKTSGNTIRMESVISDTGIGMSAEFMQNMFEPFSQENREPAAVSQGTGLGLSIAKHICDLMGMTISAVSQPGQGTTFTLCGEFACADTVPPLPAADKAPDAPVRDNCLRDKIILVCEDHPLNQEIIRRLLEKKGAIVVLADDGRRGVETFENACPESFAAILMDVRMPVLDGLQAARAIRALPRPDAAAIPILALTANAYAEDIKECLDAGMNAHIAKPIDPDSLYRALKRYL